MRLTLPIVLILMALLGSCTKEELRPCILDLLEAEDDRWVPVDNQTSINCELYMEAYSWRGNVYYLAGSHCMNLIASPIDCNSITLCNAWIQGDCQEFHLESTSLGIVAYRTE